MVGSNYEGPLYILRDPRRKCYPGMPHDVNVSEVYILIPILQVFLPGKAIFAGIGVLLCCVSSLIPFVLSIVTLNTDGSQAAKDVSAARAKMLFLRCFERIEAFSIDWRLKLKRHLTKKKW